MEDILALYAEPYDPLYPVVCFDESPYPLISEVRHPLPPAPGYPVRDDYEYRREGTCHRCRCVQPLAGWRHVEVTERRTARDFAAWMKALVDEHFPPAELISVVLDHRNTHTPAALDETCSPAEARRMVRQLDFRDTPKHGSWLNRAELELAVLDGPCVDRRRPNLGMVQREVVAWETARNAAKATVQWQFTVAKARTKLRHLYAM
jgi:hypothetical protein